MKLKYNFRIRVTAVIALSGLLSEILFPISAFALTGGPSQPEVQSFTPAGVTDMVDAFTGDFTYNLPLLDVDGYPINLAYQSGVTTDQEASWVGLGWNLNPGVVSRTVRGLPDDFRGETVDKNYNIKPNRTIGVGGSFGAELFGYDGLKLTYGVGISFNNYTGVGFEQTLNVSFTAASKAANPNNSKLSLGFTSNANGLTISPSYSLQEKESEAQILGASASFNSRTGLQSLTLSYNPQSLHKHEGGIGETTIPFGMPTYTPKIDMSMVTTSVNASFKAGVTFFGLEGTGNLSGYFTNQRLLRREENLPAYGYMYSDAAGGNSTALMDFNREKDQSFSENTPALPVTNYTYDIFTVTGQGVGGAFRPYRSDFGYVYDNHAENKSNSYSIGVELSGSEIVKVGADVGVNLVSGSSGAWTDDNQALSSINFSGKDNSDLLYEPYYFKKAGEVTAESDSKRFDEFGGTTPVKLEMDQADGLNMRTTPNLVSDDGSLNLGIDKPKRSVRQRRNEMITVLTKAQADKFGLSSDITSSSALDHHIAAITSLRPDGSRYVYGIAAYNTRKEETTFAVGKSSADDNAPDVDYNTGLVGFSDKQASKSNASGLDHYYNSTTTPAYGHSYLLTAVLSADYADVDAIRGPSDGDLGQYKKFNYTKYTDQYKWRIPVGDHRANYNPGLRSDPMDDKADYVYGEKELWYLQSIETKNFIAIFTTSPRADGFGVKDNQGDRGDIGMLKLDKISLYSKRDWQNNGAGAVPIKEVHFEYDYSLCGEVPNNDHSTVTDPNTGANLNLKHGKLTLKKVYFTFANSFRGAYSPYTFYYRQDQANYNHDYDLKAYDRWGCYKPNPAVPGCYDAGSSALINSEVPYVEQDKTKADQYTTQWLLTEVDLPSGGKIMVDYESDDYGYVQNKRAMQMFNVSTIAEGPLSTGGVVPSTSNTLMYQNNPVLNTWTSNLYLCFPLQNAISTTDPNAEATFIKQYLDGVDDIHFRFLMDITKNGGNYEYVTGYAELNKDINGTPIAGLLKATSGSANYGYGYIQLKSVGIGDRKDGGTQVNPICKAAWQFGRQNMPSKVWDSPDMSQTGEEQVIRALAASDFAKNIIETFKGPNRTIRDKSYGITAMLAKSWIRLNSPTKSKLGGGSRVKEIQIQDNWSNMASGQSTFQYGQTYAYTKWDPDLKMTISSGVASYEPQIGGEENPLHLPVWFGEKEQKVLAPDDKFFMEEPFGECFYPSPSIGYSQVKISSLRYTNVTKHATGYTLNKYYTAADFPTISERTSPDIFTQETNPIFKIFSMFHEKHLTAGQGFVVELNDMHGKIKSTEVYPEGQSAPISKKEYFYKSERYSNSNRLVNTATLIYPNGNTGAGTIGQDYDIVADMREQETNTFSTAIGLNLNTFFAFIPIPVPTAFPMISIENTRFRSAVITKVVNHYGLLDEVIATDNGSQVSTKNLAYDAETGDVLLTQTTNKFSDPIYNFSYPAHWYYDGMGPAYKNLGISISLSVGSAGTVTLTNAQKYFVPGDEIVLETSNDRIMAWVASTTPTTISLIDESGTAIPSGSYPATIVRSGRRNLQTNMMGSITTGVNPLSFIAKGNISNVLNSDAVEYVQDAQTFCECFNYGTYCTEKTANPYVAGIKGVWRVKKKYSYLTDRGITLKNNNTNIRSDGEFTSFTPFWKYNGNQWVMDATNWTWTTEVTIFSPYNVDLEDRDALMRYSAAVYGYNNSLPTATGSNSKYGDLGFDNFEDYDFQTCVDDHFSFKNNSANVVNNKAHTGQRSMHVTANNSVSTLRQTNH